MAILRKAALAATALSIVAAPVAASAAAGARAASPVAGDSALEGNSSWVIGLIGLLAGVTAIILIADDDDDAPVSP